MLNKYIMKKLSIIMLALLMVSMATAQQNGRPGNVEPNGDINTIIVNSSSDITLLQGDKFAIDYEEGSNWSMEDSILYLSGNTDFTVTVDHLQYLDFYGSGDIVSKGTLKGKDFSVRLNGSGDMVLDLDYENVCASLYGSGDLRLRGRCHALMANNFGSGDLITKELNSDIVESSQDRVGGVPNLDGLSELLAELGANLERLADSVDWDSFGRDMERWGEGMEEWGRHMEEWGEQVERQMEGKEPRPERWGKGIPDNVPQPKAKMEPAPKERQKEKSLFFDPHWEGIDAGLNMLLGPGANADFVGEFNYLELKPLKSWVFNFNIADVGLAFSRSHVAGIYTGIGLGWNNYSFNNPVRLVKGDDGLEGIMIDESQEGRVKKSKLGALYVQAPLMLEVRPTRHFFIAAGVTGGIRVSGWTKVKFMDKYKEKNHSDYYMNLLKLDACLRAGSNDAAFFVSYNLLPLFVEAKGPTAHTLNIGFSLIF